MNKSAIELLFDYHYGMYDRIWEIAMELTPAQFKQDTDYSIGSVRNHLVHCISVDDRWSARLQHLAPPESPDPEDFADQASLRLVWDEIRARVMNYVEALTEEELEQRVELHFPDQGGTLRNLRWQILLHMVNHGTDHRAQILALLHRLSARTIEQDFDLDLWSTAQG